MNNISRDFFEIASLLIGVSLISMLVLNARGTVQVIEATGTTFGSLLNAATGRGQF